MFKILTLIFFLLSFLTPAKVFAKSDNFVSIVNPVRGFDFWDLENQQPQDVVKEQIRILQQFNLPATWLIRFDVLGNQEMLSDLPGRDEKGLFLEVTPAWTKKAGIKYHQSDSWHNAGSAFLTGYEPAEREKLIDMAFDEFKKFYSFYPKSVGAWWIDGHSLMFMQKKYGITAALVVSDQYSTDNYQIWGQYFSTPYYPSKENALHPAQNLENKLPVVITQWAIRDPINAYGNGVFESTFSLQANDYLDYHNLDVKYFSKLLDIYTNQPFNKFSHLVVGLENSYYWDKYQTEYQNQIKILRQKSDLGQFRVINLGEFARWYQIRFPNLSPEQIIVADDPLQSFKKVVWFMNPYYRAGWFYNQQGSLFRDIRQYIDGEGELCLKKRCESVNFATSATRVLDEVSFGHNWVIDEGKISDFKVTNDTNLLISYLNEAGKLRTIEFLPRDIIVDGKISSIDAAILNATKQDEVYQAAENSFQNDSFRWSAFSIFSKIIRFLLFLVGASLIPGLIFVDRLFQKNTPTAKKVFLSLIIGFVLLTIIFYAASLMNLRFIVYIYVLTGFLLFLNLRVISRFNFIPKLQKQNLPSALMILAGTIFQNIPTFKNGLIYPFGIGFWGPNTHDGIWHISLINQLAKSLPAENPIFAGNILKNYHYFYDLLIAGTVFLTKIPVPDLVFRFYPVIFSLLLGIGSYYLALYLFKNKIAVFFSLYFVYFAGSFGWIVEYIKFRRFGGESAFWANQSISFNLNPPFAISLLIVIAILQLLPFKSKISTLVLTLLCGILIAFKAYAAILILLTFLLVGILKRNTHFLAVFLFGSAFSALLFLSNFSLGQQLIIFSPFWFIHSMIDSPDRVGWTRLALARVAGLEQGNWFKLFAAEAISLTIFILGNLGARFLALFSLIRIKNIFANVYYLFLFIFSFLSLLIPIFFIQAGNPWNTIQFIYYFLYVSALIGGLVLAKIVIARPKPIIMLASLLFLAISPINSYVTAKGYLSYLPHALISNLEIEALEFLRSQKDGIVLTYPYDKNLKTRMAEPWPLLLYDSTGYVSAFSNKAVYLEDEPQNQILLTDYKKRLVAAKDFFSNSFKGHEFLVNNGIKYIYLPKVYNVYLDEKALNAKNMFSNNEVIIFKVE